MKTLPEIAATTSVTSLYVGAFGLIYVMLSFYVVVKRIQHKTPFGEGTVPDLTAAVRIHANFAEYVPFILLMMALYEMQAHGNTMVLHVSGIALLLARSAHGFGLYKSKLMPRQIGMVMTQTLIVFLAVMLIVQGVRTMTGA